MVDEAGKGGGGMKTRRSPANQEQLWRALGGAKNPAVSKRGRLPTRAEARKAMFAEKKEVAE